RDYEEDFIELADKLIRTDIPDEEEDPELHELVTRLQLHRHSFTCQKLKKPRFKISEKEAKKLPPKELDLKKADAMCRFEYRRPESAKTQLHHELPRLLRPDPDSSTSTSHDILMASPAKSDTTEQLLSPAKSMSTSSLDSDSGKDLPKIRRIRSLQKEAEQKKIERRFQTASVKMEMKRKATDGYTNNYNSAILRLWRANMDIQMVTNTWAACQYICSYVAKSEKELGETMVEVLKNIPDGTSAIQRLRKIANAFMGARSVSAQEAIHRILGLNMLEKTRLVQFLMTGFPKQRHRTSLYKAVAHMVRSPGASLTA
ncbi:MAG: hypothetical protein AAF357_12480, partial [Verrucomicrobiota bacterium]